ncbi:MAG: DUF1269 domain-containing protein [Chloroflexi bacterium]|nr:DUF1269 domain-containing protein [Ardenticatenaceae bacterium]MBL1128960.1 DUF1269 domain-containing protein [Chloroflexota bacterium]NOG35040.1 DUF1269 domain-containing protein [Chloroflexota bacterium]GIK58150.1 MAG: hypothetical protein BroJett015_38130 [Chloroflexota bacterium]
MSDVVPVQLIVAAFQSENGAKDAWMQLKAAKWGGLIKIERMAIVRRTTKDKVKIRESGDPGGGRGAVVGTVVGGVIGAIAGPLGAVVVGGATGALVGGVTAKFYDSGIPDERLKKIGEALKPGTSAIVAIIEHKWVKELEKDLREAGADVLTEMLSQDIAQQLDAGNEMAFTAIAGEEGLAVARVAGNEKKMESQSMVISEEGMAVEALHADESGIAIYELVTDGDAVITGAGVITAGDGDEETDGAGVITKDGDEETDGAGVITEDGDEETDGAGVITGGGQ